MRYQEGIIDGRTQDRLRECERRDAARPPVRVDSVVRLRERDVTPPTTLSELNEYEGDLARGDDSVLPVE